jgi:hypothetical protein
MKGWIAALDAACARANPALPPIAAAIAPLDIAVATQQWTAVHPLAPVPAGTVVADVRGGGCALVLAPELSGMAGRD